MSSLDEKLQAPERRDAGAARATLKQLLSRWHVQREVTPEEVRIWSMGPEPEVWVRESEGVFRQETKSEGGR